MVLYGYVVLKVQKTALFYADWTNTRRRYPYSEMSDQQINDLRRIFVGKTFILIPDMKRNMPTLLKILGKPINTTRCKDVEYRGTAMNILTQYLNKNGKRKSYYNYQRDHYLSILSVINIHLIEKGSMREDELLKIISFELNKHNRRIPAETLLEKFIEIKMFIKHPNYKHSIVSIPDRRIDLTLG
jgi:hypothetical protein